MRNVVMRIKKIIVVCIRHAVHYHLGQVFILWSITHMSNFIPIERLRETNNTIAFYHPEPTYPVHILIVPKRSIPTFLDLASTDVDLIMEILRTAQSLVEELKLAEVGYRLIVNGGKYQDLPQLHFHLISGNPSG